MARMHIARSMETEMRVYLLPMMFVIAAGVAGCNGTSSETVTTYISTQTSDGSIVVHAPGRADAHITAAGDLSIAAQPVILPPLALEGAGIGGDGGAAAAQQRQADEAGDQNLVHRLVHGGGTITCFGKWREGGAGRGRLKGSRAQPGSRTTRLRMVR